VTPSKVKPLAEVKEKAIEMWKAEQRQAALDEKAKQLAGQVGAEKPLATVASEAGLTASTTQPFGRAGAEAGIPPALATRLFAAKPGEVVTASGPTGAWIGQLKEVIRPEAKPGSPGLDQVAKQLDTAMRNDVFAAYDRTLRSRYGVTVNQADLRRLF